MTDIDWEPTDLATLEQVGETAMGAGATTLSILLNQQVQIGSPTAQIAGAARVAQLLQEPAVIVEMPFTVGDRLQNAFVFGQADTARITDLMMGGEGSPPDSVIDELRLSAISEAVNQMMGMAANALTSSYGKKFETSVPQATVVDRPDEMVLPESFGPGPYIIITYQFAIEGLVESQIFQLMPADSARILVEEVAKKTSKPEPGPLGSPPSGGETLSATIPPPQAPLQGMPGDQAALAGPAYPPPPYGPPGYPPGAYPGVPGYPPGAPYPPGAYPPSGYPPGQPPPASQRDLPQATPVQFGPLVPAPPPAPPSTGLDLIMDVPLRVTVELGRTRMQIRDVLELGKGYVVELDKLAGEPVDLLVNGKLIARGEVVVIDENFGIRITDIVSPAERVTGFRGIGVS